MEKEFVTLEKYKGEHAGEFAKIWIAADVHGQFYMTQDLEMKQTKDGFEPDFQATKWKSITNERHHQITDELSLIESNKIVKTKTNMDKTQEEIYKTGYTGLTATEDFQTVRNFVVARSNAEKDIHDKLFKEYEGKVSNPEFKKVFQEYYAESNKGGIFGKSDQKVLEKHLKELYILNHNHFVKDRSFAERLVGEKGHQIHISLEAENLLKGGATYSTELAAKEAKTLRERLQQQHQELIATKKENKDLSLKVTQLNQALTNLVGNLKSMLGIGEEKINEMMKTPPKQELDKSVKKETVKSKDVQIGM